MGSILVQSKSLKKSFHVDILELFLVRTSVQMKSYVSPRNFSKNGAAVVEGPPAGHFPPWGCPQGSTEGAVWRIAQVHGRD